MRLEKKGELTTQQIVVLIILIASFAVIVYFLVNLGLGNESDKDICHNSVVMRGASVVPTESVPLDCKRSYVCISADGSCEGMTKPIVKKVSNNEDVYSVLAEEMASCWWMYGEGKIDYVGKDYFENLYCSVCSQVAFDDSVGEKIFKEGYFEKEELYSYMSFNNVSSSDETYMEYLYKTNDYASLVNSGDSVLDFGKIDLLKQYYVLTGITSEVGNLGWIVTGAVAVGTGTLFFVSGPVGWVVGAVAIGVAAGGVSGNYIASFVKGDSGNEFIAPTLIEVNSKEFKSLKCDEISSAS